MPASSQLLGSGVPRVGSQAPSLTLLDAAGAPAVLSELWAAGPLLLTFLRHYG